MKAAIEAMRNKEMGSYKAFRVFNLPQKHRSVMLNIGRKVQVKQWQQNWLGSKFFHVKQKIIWLNTVFWWKENFGLDNGRSYVSRLLTCCKKRN